MSVPLLLALSVEFGLGTADLLRIIGTAPARYKVYSIPKRNGGARVIAQPSRELKDIQRFILRTLYLNYPFTTRRPGMSMAVTSAKTRKCMSMPTIY